MVWTFSFRPARGVHDSDRLGREGSEGGAGESEAGRQGSGELKTREKDREIWVGSVMFCFLVLRCSGMDERGREGGGKLGREERREGRRVGNEGGKGKGTRQRNLCALKP